MQLLASVVGVVLLAGLFGWLVTRAWRASNPLVKWPGLVLSIVLTLLPTAVAVVALIGFARITLPASNPVPTVQIASTPERLARGERLGHICAGCHSTESSLPLRGGMENFAAIPGGPTLGSIYGSNLTPGGATRTWSDGELVRAIREGVGKNGRPLLIMPSDSLRNLSDADVEAIVAYLRGQPAVDRSTPPTELNLLGALLVGAGLFPTSVQPPAVQPVTAPPVGPTVEYGRYALLVGGCAACHGDRYTGGIEGGFAPSGPNIVAAAQRWTDAQFLRTFRTGVSGDNRTLDPQRMPWKDISPAFTDDELQAIYNYLKTLPLS